MLIGGVNVKEYDLEFLRSKIGIVMQKTELFSGSIEENIRWGDENSSMDDIIYASEIAQADEYILQMTEKYGAYVAEKGSSLSGGQKQRLSIARAVVKKPEILIFDDSTSALDLSTESKLKQKLRENFKGKTIITIAQRIASVKDCDRIAVIDNGRLSACGTHEELFETSDIYRDIYNSQIKKGAVENG
ncbi:Alpha-hemolysin translocation ATP-binding protein HlyB [bioreactor metagenome]|uniref:Alpha-hemolysin translocation ATP-binding protein HlyB n=1 Tax=bioreactor metagenome TaxID=1076179 RepID=A0A645D3R4_9ZZZZ